jgi:hypothetical protein
MSSAPDPGSSGSSPDASLHLEEAEEALALSQFNEEVESFASGCPTVTSEASVRIHRLCIAGRPPRSYPASMGDHTTPFAAHLVALCRMTEGGTLQEAVLALKLLFERAMALPGARFYEWTNSNQQRWRDLGRKLDRALTQLSIFPSCSGFQQAVGLYLQYRELIPLSTVNTAPRAPATAGKGKGEGRFSRNVAGEASGTKAGEGHLDFGAITSLLAEQVSEIRRRMAPYQRNDGQNDYETLVVDFLRQHAESIVADGDDFEERVNQKVLELRASFDFKMKQAWLDEMNWHGEKLEAVIRARPLQFVQIGSIRDSRNALKFLWSTRSSLIRHAVSVQRLRALLEGPEIEEGDWRDSCTPSQKAYINDLEKRIEACWEVLETKGAKDLENLRREYPHAAVVEPASQEELPTAHILEAPEIPEDEDLFGGLAVQLFPRPITCDPFVVQLVERNGIIRQVIFGSRPRSPHSNTMGAHQIAWIAICDWVSLQVVNRDVTPDSISAIARSLLALPGNFVKIFRAGNPPAGDIAKSVAQGIVSRMAGAPGFPIAGTGSLPELLLDAVGFILRALDTTPPTSLPQLQEFIWCVLSLTNIIPGVTLATGGTNPGRNEGQPRGILLDADSSEAARKSAINRMLDLGEDFTGISDAAKAFVRSAYPRVAIRLSLAPPPSSMLPIPPPPPGIGLPLPAPAVGSLPLPPPLLSSSPFSFSNSSASPVLRAASSSGDSQTEKRSRDDDSGEPEGLVQKVDPNDEPMPDMGPIVDPADERLDPRMSGSSDAKRLRQDDKDGEPPPGGMLDESDA